MKVGQQLVRQAPLNSSNDFRCCVGKHNFWHIVPFAWSGRKLAGGRVGMRRLKLLEVGGSSAAQSLCKTAAAAVEESQTAPSSTSSCPVLHSWRGSTRGEGTEALIVRSGTNSRQCIMQKLGNVRENSDHLVQSVE